MREVLRNDEHHLVDLWFEVNEAVQSVSVSAGTPAQEERIANCSEAAYGLPPGNKRDPRSGSCLWEVMAKQ
jgi:hypothetical protein